jgi:hypothetical protein
MTGLDPLDEQLNHQTPRPFRVAGTTDHRFYDRHWFEAVAPLGDVLIISGCGVYKNMGVCDGFLCVKHEGRQYNVRVSRPLGDHLLPEAGPLAIAVVEPFRRMRLSLAAGDYPIAADLQWTSTFEVCLEEPHVQMADGRLIQDTSRYDQVGRWDGWLRLGDHTYDVADWWGVRDHSWGVRQDVGGFESPHGHQRSSTLWLWTQASTGDECVYFQVRESGSGALEHLEGAVTGPLGSGTPPDPVVAVAHDIHFVDGTRAWDRLRYDVRTASGRELVLEAEALQSAWAYRGTGYENGYEDSRGVGVPRGDLVETDVLDVAHPQWVRRNGEDYKPGHREQPARLTIDGRAGYGHLPVMSSGRIERYGLGRPERT